MYNQAVSRRRIVAFVVAAILMFMVGAMVYEVFDIHDPKPFPIDPEFLVYMFSTILVLCFGTVVLTVALLNFYLSLLELLPSRLLNLMPGLRHRYEAFEVEHILFSPPLSTATLRI